ncbi:hypothetical protein DDB_G0281881 [Dictyostelium discoideum AX4]|uniref:Uncharacterized protein n=1 Tax=Dictyostelium discoideum TaxID=44689 RepID=Q54TB3_DICDI|nr:hypothetical protein DDB_G0281881 [Dictyostelium discoideum AX4]EAL66500.1 hypothetical protein DDB_G0281881 [Dictyostelium discoideum AX4]|eukprot:XP_640476.1 hypothetical protein DDB_G0281881 [Dictyostelium discoideum AX4]
MNVKNFNHYQILENILFFIVKCSCTLYTEKISNGARDRTKKHLEQGRKGTFNLNRQALDKLCENYENRYAITSVKFVKRSDEPNSLSPKKDR